MAVTTSSHMATLTEENDMNDKLSNLIAKFNQESRVSIKIDGTITLAEIFKAGDDIAKAIKRLHKAKKTLDVIHAEYTLSLERE